MDTLWTIILILITHVQSGIFQLISPLHVLGPEAAIAAAAFVTVFFARLFTGRFKTRRYKALEKEFRYWYHVKQEALKLKQEDPEKARQLGINIDKAKLNEVYYNYFFEGLLNNLLTMYIPVFSMMAFVNYTYMPGSLEEMFGRRYLFEISWINGGVYQVGAVFWFVFCVFASYALLFAAGRLLRRHFPGSGERAPSVCGTEQTDEGCIHGRA